MKFFFKTLSVLLISACIFSCKQEISKNTPKENLYLKKDSTKILDSTKIDIVFKPFLKKFTSNINFGNVEGHYYKDDSIYKDSLYLSHNGKNYNISEAGVFSTPNGNIDLKKYNFFSFAFLYESENYYTLFYCDIFDPDMDSYWIQKISKNTLKTIYKKHIELYDNIIITTNHVYTTSILGLSKINLTTGETIWKQSYSPYNYHKIKTEYDSVVLINKDTVKLKVKYTQDDFIKHDTVKLNDKTGDIIYSFNRKDKEQIKSHISKVLHWADNNLDFELLPNTVSENDSIITGFDFSNFHYELRTLRETSFFTNNFIENYQAIIETIHEKLKTNQFDYPWVVGNHPPFNFGIGGNPWCLCQDNLGWWKIKIKHVQGNQFYWQWEVSEKSDPSWKWHKYHFKVKKEFGGWKIDYLEGFDINNIL